MGEGHQPRSDILKGLANPKPPRGRTAIELPCPTLLGVPIIMTGTLGDGYEGGIDFAPAPASIRLVGRLTIDRDPLPSKEDDHEKKS